MALTDRQELFCAEYIVDGNGTRAAIRAGYGEKRAGATACRLLRRADVRGRIDALLAGVRQQRIADAAEVQAYLTACIRGQDDDMPGRERLKAAELLGKIYGLFTDRLEAREECPVIVYRQEGEADEAGDEAEAGP